jgi:hypothetical protein
VPIFDNECSAIKTITQMVVSGGSRHFEKRGGGVFQNGGHPKIANNFSCLGSKILTFTNIES